MGVPARLLAILLTLTLAGGAQACIALCAPSAKSADKSTCRHCGDKNSKPNPATPCKHCQIVNQPGLAVEKDQTIKAPIDLAFAPIIESTPLVFRAPGERPEPHHNPSGERLHQFCLLLI